jgi:hypothetical protein
MLPTFNIYIMKKLLILLFCFPLFSIAQQKTHVPDDAFEAYIESYGWGDGVANNDSVLTNSIQATGWLNINFSSSQGFIYNMKGIEDFTSLSDLHMNDHKVSHLDLSNNPLLSDVTAKNNSLITINLDGLNNLETITIQNNFLLKIEVSSDALLYIDCSNNLLDSLIVGGGINGNSEPIIACFNNNITYLDVSNCPYLDYLDCHNNQLTTLDFSNNIDYPDVNLDSNLLTNLLLSNTGYATLSCQYNLFDSLDLSNTIINTLNCSNNPQLSYLSVNDQGTIWDSLYAVNNPNLYCIEVNDSTWATANWTVANGNIDPWASFDTSCYVPPPASWDCIAGACIDPLDGSGTYSSVTTCQAICNATAIEENNTTKQLLKITDVLGRESKPTPNVPLFYIYDDGTVEKKLIIE